MSNRLKAIGNEPHLNMRIGLGSTGAGEAVSEVPKAETLSGLHELFHLHELV